MHLIDIDAMEKGESRMTGQDESAILREVVRQLSKSLGASCVPVGEDQILRSVYELTPMLRALVDAWTTLCSDASIKTDDSWDFYSDEMLGYNLCERFNSAYYTLWDFGIVSADQILSDSQHSLNDEVFDLLVRYIELQVTFNGLGDITKRTYEAIAALCLYNDRYLDRLNMLRVDEMHFDWKAKVIGIWEMNQG